MNIELFKKVRDLIASKPTENFQMGDWIIDLDNDSPSILGNDPDELSEMEEIPTCGTAMCIAGWTVYAVNPRRLVNYYGRANNGGIDILAIDGLQISSEEARMLFYMERWPTKYQDMGEREGALALLDRMIEDQTSDVLYERGY